MILRWQKIKSWMNLDFVHFIFLIFYLINSPSIYCKVILLFLHEFDDEWFQHTFKTWKTIDTDIIRLHYFTDYWFEWVFVLKVMITAFEIESQSVVRFYDGRLFSLQFVSPSAFSLTIFALIWPKRFVPLTERSLRSVSRRSDADDNGGITISEGGKTRELK